MTEEIKFPMVWENPPPPPNQDRLNQTVAELKANPGRWALIDSGETVICPWWGSLYNNKEFEVRFVRKDRAIFGSRDVYVRYVGDPACRDDAQ